MSGFSSLTALEAGESDAVGTLGAGVVVVSTKTRIKQAALFAECGARCTRVGLNA